jgi:hypothetical protein
MFVHTFFFLDHFVRWLCWCITFDCSSQVRPVLYFRRYDYLLKEIAHWHRQHCHLERAEARHSHHGCHMGVQHWVLHPKYAPFLHTIENPIENVRCDGIRYRAGE